jgi:MFS family permease
VSVQSATSILTISAVALMGGQLASGYLLDRFPAKRVAGFFFLLALIGIVSLSLETRGIAVLGGTCLAFGIGAEGNLAPFLVSRYFGLARFSEIFGYILAISVLANGAGPWLIARSYDIQGSYSVALGGSAVALILASLLIFGLGQYPHPAALILSDKSRPVRL